jgi:hypothetical protein
MADEPEVRIRIVADDQSEATLEKVKAGFEHVEQSTKHAATAGHDLAGEVLKGNIYFELAKKGAEAVAEAVKVGVESMEKMTEASLEAAEAQEKQERQMAGYLFLMDQGKHSMAQLRDYTGQQREEFEAFGMSAGIAVKDLVGAYDNLIERGSMSSEKAKDLTEQMAIVGKVVPGGMEGLAQGMSGVEMGMVRARNPVVQLIAATHLLKGNARDVAQQMQKMSPERQMELAERAIARQADALKKMGAAVPTMEQLKTSFEGVKESFLESMGKPMLGALVPQLARLRDYLVQHIEEIKAFGERVGRAASDVIEYVGTALDGIYSGVSENWEEFRQTFHQIWGDWEDAWASATRSTGDIKVEFHEIGVTLRNVFVEIMRYVKAAGEVIMDASDLWSQVAAAKDELIGGKEFDEHGNKVVHKGRAVGSTDASIQAAALAEQARNPMQSQQEWERNKDVFVAKAQNAGMKPEEVDAYVAGLAKVHDQFEKAAQDDKAAVASQNWAKVNEALQYNIDHHQEALNDYVIQQIAGSEQARDALLHGGITIAGGMDAMMKLLNEKAPELAAKLRGPLNPLSGKGITAPKLTQNFHGGIHIKQDFKDQDPDRILLTFRRDLANAAANRTVSRVSTPFGF